MLRTLGSYVVTDLDPAFTVASADGWYVKTSKGRRILDFTAGGAVCALGYGRPEVSRRVARQAQKGVYACPAFDWAPWEKLAERLVRILPRGLTRVIRATSGSEAVEFAVKLVRSSTRGGGIASLGGAYHGHTVNAAALGEWSKSLGARPPGFVRLSWPRSGGWDRTVTRLRALAKAGRVRGFLTEAILSSPGVFVPPRAFWREVTEICARYDVVLGIDEVLTGFGRCGAPFASQLFGLRPDILMLGKALSAGYAGIGATVTTEALLSKCDFVTYSTYGWHPVAVEAALAVLEVMEREKLAENSARVGKHLLARLRASGSELVKEVRGAGLLIALELEARRMPKDIGFRFHAACLERGLFVLPMNPWTLAFSPPLTITKAVADEAADIVADALRSVERTLRST